MTEDKNLLAASYDWWSHNGSIKPMQLKIALGSGKEPAMTIHPDGKITLGENAEPTEAAAECIDAMSHVIQSIIDRAVSEERAKPDPLADVLKDFGGFMPDAEDFRAALKARGLEIRSKNDD